MVTARKPKPVPLRDYNAMRARAEVAEARVVALAESLKAVLAGIPHEFAKPETQATRMHARALVAEMERR